MKGTKGTKAPHGTPARYMGHGCRCDECRTAGTAYFRAWRWKDREKTRAQEREQKRRWRERTGKH